MNPFSPHDTSDAQSSSWQPPESLSESPGSLSRVANVIARGSWEAFADTARHPLDKIPELALSAATGAGLGSLGRLGASGRFLSAAAGAAMFAKFSYDEWSGKRWSRFGSALQDAWRSPQNMDANVDIVKNSLGSFLVDLAVGSSATRLGSFAAGRLAPPAKLLPHAFRRLERDGGEALLQVQNRFENRRVFENQVEGKLSLIAHNQPAVPGMPRGDLVRVATTPDGKILLAAMDVEGHGVKAAKKAVLVHKAIDDVLPQTTDKSASDILALVDGKLSSADDLAITAGLMKFDPLTRNLETATASSHFAYVVRATGKVSQLDKEVGGLGLGTDMYSFFPRGNDVILLRKGDTAIMASDGVFDRFGYGNKKGFEDFLVRTGPDAERIRRGILQAPEPLNGADDASFIVFTAL